MTALQLNMFLDGYLQKDASDASRKYACLMLHPDSKQTAALLKFFRSFIAAADVYDDAKHAYGIENSPHITILYGLHSDDAKAAFKPFHGQSPVFCFIKGVSIFETPEYDVVKFDITGGRTQQMHETAKGAGKHTLTYPDYIPHMTIAYVKKGTGKKYAGKKTEWDGKRIMGRRLRFSPADSSEQSWMYL